MTMHQLPSSDSPATAPSSVRTLPLGHSRASRIPPTPGEQPTPPRAWHNLPHALSSFVGRGPEIAEASRLLGETRLLTLTGAGGIGKTRLGHEIAAGLLDRSSLGSARDGSGQAFRDGVWLVDLATLTEAGQVPQAVAAVLGVPEDATRPLTATLADALRTDQLLLVLDNCEQLVEACAALADALLRACPRLRILATSHQALGIAGETTFRVPPLSEAARLFVERAQAVMPGFVLTDHNTPAVEEICQRLDGLPLAIELAAARVAVLSPEQIAARLDDRLPLLSRGSRLDLPRHRSLRALLDWSHALLTEPEQLLVRRLAVFAGDWSLAAAEAVCADENLGSADVLDLLSGLVAKSVVIPCEAGPEVRYRLPESVRLYAAERLRGAGEEAAIGEQYAAWLRALTARGEPEPERAGPPASRRADHAGHPACASGRGRAAPPSRPEAATSPPVHPVPLAAPAVLWPRGSRPELTSREQEVAALVARGLTNRQIGATLVIAPGTAANHVKHILARLTLDSRVQIAAWAVERGLTGRAAAGSPSVA
jgi:non-specific serine/threonine protein kinase